MPPYAWLIEQKLDITTTASKIRAMQTLGVPYPEGYDKRANDDLKIQAEKIALDLKQNNIKVKSDKEIVAIIAYLQRLGQARRLPRVAGASAPDEMIRWGRSPQRDYPNVYNSYTFSDSPRQCAQRTGC